MTHWVTLLNILSLSGISMGKQALCRSLLESVSPSSLQHWIPVSSSPRTVGVCVMSWSTNWPHCISINVYFSLSLWWFVLKELLIRARSFDSTGVIILPKTTNASIHNTTQGVDLNWKQWTHLFWCDIEAAETSLGDGKPEERGVSTPSSYSGGSNLCKAVFELPQDVRSMLLHVPSSVRNLLNSSLYNETCLPNKSFTMENLHCIVKTVPFAWTWRRWASLLDWWPLERKCGQGKPSLVFVQLETCH